MQSAEWRNSQGPAAVMLEDGFNLGEQRKLGEALVNAAFGPVDFQTAFVAIEEPGGGLLDGSLFEVRGESALAGAGSVAGATVSITSE